MNDTRSHGKGIDLYGRDQWSSEVTERDLDEALDELFQQVASDLGVDSAVTPEFRDYAGMMMCDAGVPNEVVDKALGRLKP